MRRRHFAYGYASGIYRLVMEAEGLSEIKIAEFQAQEINKRAGKLLESRVALVSLVALVRHQPALSTVTNEMLRLSFERQLERRPR
jgi:hypothetical protein